MASRALAIPWALVVTLFVTAIPAPALAKVVLSQAGLRTLPKPLQSAGSQLADALPATAELLHSEISNHGRRSLATRLSQPLDTSCDTTNVKPYFRHLATVKSGSVTRNLRWLRFTNTCAYNLVAAYFSRCPDFDRWQPNGLSNPIAPNCNSPGDPGFQGLPWTLPNGKVIDDVFCNLQINQGSCKSEPYIQLLPGQSVSFYFLDDIRNKALYLCTYDVTFDTPGPGRTRKLDKDLVTPDTCAPNTDAAPQACLPRRFKDQYCIPGRERLIDPSCDEVTWCP